MGMYTDEMLQRALGIVDETIDLAIRIHRDLGPALLESSYEQILSSFLRRNGHRVVNEMPVRFVYDGITVENNYRLDLLVDDILAIELKAVEKMAPVHYKQALTYTKILNHPIGLLLNFGGETIPGHFSRIINTTHPLAQALSNLKGFRG